MNPFDNLNQQPQDDSGQYQTPFFNLPTDLADLFQPEQTSETEQFFQKSTNIIKLACGLFIMTVVGLCLFFIAAPFVRFIIEASWWAFKKVGGIF